MLISVMECTVSHNRSISGEASSERSHSRSASRSRSPARSGDSSGMRAGMFVVRMTFCLLMQPPNASLSSI